MSRGFTRRRFLRSGGLALFGAGAGISAFPGFLLRAAESGRRRGRTLVVVFQRGAVDGLNMVVPFAEPAYAKLRPGIAVPPPKRGATGRALDLDGFFGFHPEMQALADLYHRKMLAVVHAAGSPHSTRSHFDAQDFMESGTPGVRSTRDGWLNRYLQHRPATDPAPPLRAVALTRETPRILHGRAPVVSVPRLEQFRIDRGRQGPAVRGALERLYSRSPDPRLAAAAGSTFEAIDILDGLDPDGPPTKDGLAYPRGAFGTSMRQIARMIRSDIGLEVAFTEIGGWDHHVNEGGVRGPLARLLGEFSSGIGAFVKELGDRMDDVVVVTLSEFGRTAAENGNRGTDHGHATALLALGGPVRGGRVMGRWPGLEPEQLHEGRDLALTTDFRNILGEVLVRHLGARQLEPIFPGFRWARDPGSALLG